MVLEFMFGVIAAYSLASGRLHEAAFLAAATLVIYFALGAIAEHRLIFGLAMGFIVVAMVRAERAGRLRVPAFLTFLGAASYSIYLVHNPVAALSPRLFEDWRLAFAVAALAGMSAGIIFHLLFEKPALRLLSGRPRRSGDHPAPIAAPQGAEQG